VKVEKLAKNGQMVQNSQPLFAPRIRSSPRARNCVGCGTISHARLWWGGGAVLLPSPVFLGVCRQKLELLPCQQTIVRECGPSGIWDCRTQQPSRTGVFPESWGQALPPPTFRRARSSRIPRCCSCTAECCRRLERTKSFAATFTP
jgi:hypothetical protein